VEKCCRAGQATVDSMKHPQCMLVTEFYKCTLRMWSTYCFFHATNLRESASGLRHTYNACLVLFKLRGNSFSLNSQIRASTTFLLSTAGN